MVNEIKVYIAGGAVQDIINIPENTKVTVVDFDIEGVDEELLEKTDDGMALIQTWNESEGHGPDTEEMSNEEYANARLFHQSDDEQGA